MKRLRQWTRLSLILVYLVIVAGAVVRMTGSGMGCPDWPKCFGYLIPPTEESELQWQSGRAYKKGQVIIRNEALEVAKKDFTTTGSYASKNWEAYTKHDYATFNPWHTWIEFINRLFGALAGLASLMTAIAALKFRRMDWGIPAMAWIVVFAMGFQAWLGATVVYSVLEPVKITFHMVMALIIVALLIYLLHRASPMDRPKIGDGVTRILVVITLLLTLVQIILGTQVRQFVDEQIDHVGELARSLWLNDPPVSFFVHRSFAVLVLLANGYLAYRILREDLALRGMHWVMLLLLVEVASGILMYYLDFPFASQPIHLVLAAFLFGLQFHLLIQAYGKAPPITES